MKRTTIKTHLNYFKESHTTANHVISQVYLRFFKDHKTLKESMLNVCKQKLKIWSGFLYIEAKTRFLLS